MKASYVADAVGCCEWPLILSLATLFTSDIIPVTTLSIRIIAKL